MTDASDQPSPASGLALNRTRFKSRMLQVVNEDSKLLRRRPKSLLINLTRMAMARSMQAKWHSFSPTKKLRTRPLMEISQAMSYKFRPSRWALLDKSKFKRLVESISVSRSLIKFPWRATRTRTCKRLIQSPESAQSSSFPVPS